ncbi:mediator of RNA polymerase II transcription subunit 9 isoform X1 [Rhinatrema bivittatum]|uniref:mediator of RNA polymerase II transcription subunit 9 isoform X1 n=1 Tax=Rhinatrema bivittatum TaxID=194408 RepID=UPI001126FD15|nr:mediator of RNA polymerase II transcription subunit 9 isoform X1 [Rhinatrema bivittatum]
MRKKKRRTILSCRWCTTLLSAGLLRWFCAPGKSHVSVMASDELARVGIWLGHAACDLCDIGVASMAQLNPVSLSMDKDSQDVHQELSELKNKFQEMRKLISSMPGIDRSPEQQQQQLQSLREQVRTKNQLLQKYKSLCMLEIPKE